MSVPNTDKFGMTDVTVEIYGDIAAGRNLRQAFIDTNGVGEFDTNYVGSKDNLLNFRNYAKTTMNIKLVAIPATTSTVTSFIRTTLLGTNYSTGGSMSLSYVGLRELRIARNDRNYMIASYNSASIVPIAYYSSNGGSTWNAIGINNSYMFGSAISDGGSFMIQIRSNSSYVLYYSYNYGANWTTKTSGLGSGQQLRSPSCNYNGSFVWVANLTSAVNYYSTNSCSTFTAVSTPFIANSSCMDANGTKVWIASSTSTSIAWTTNKSTFNVINLSPSISTATYIVCDANGTNILVSDNSSNVWVSQNSGSSFTVKPLPALTDPSSLSVSRTGKYMCISDRTTAGRCYASYDYGSTWITVNFSGMGYRISALAIGDNF